MSSCHELNAVQEVVIKLGLVKEEKDGRPVFRRIKSSALDLTNTNGTSGVETLKKSAVRMFLRMPDGEANNIELPMFDISLTYYDDCFDEVEIITNDDIIDAFQCAKNGKKNIFATVTDVSNSTAKQPLPVASVSSSKVPTNVSQSASPPSDRPMGVNWIVNKLNSAAKSLTNLPVSNKTVTDNEVIMNEEEQNLSEVEPKPIDAEKCENQIQATINMSNEEESNVAEVTLEMAHQPDPTTTNTNRESVDTVSTDVNVVDHSTLGEPLSLPNSMDVDSRKTSEDQVTNESNPDRCFIHGRHTCDGCYKTPIVGKRFRSTTKKDFDMCEKCAAKYTGPDRLVEELDEHDRSHQDRWHERWSRMMQERSCRRRPAAARQTAADDPRPFIHVFHTCDECQTTPIIGKRFKSITSNNFDLCEKCMANYSGTDQFQEEQLDRDVHYQDRWYMRYRNRRRKRSFDCYRRQHGRLHAIIPSPEHQYTPDEPRDDKNIRLEDPVVEVIDLDAVMSFDTEDQTPHERKGSHWECSVPWHGFDVDDVVVVDETDEPNTNDMVPTTIDPDLDEAIRRSLEDQKTRTEEEEQSESEKNNTHSNTSSAEANAVVEIDEADDTDTDDIQVGETVAVNRASRPFIWQRPLNARLLFRQYDVIPPTAQKSPNTDTLNPREEEVENLDSATGLTLNQPAPSNAKYDQPDGHDQNGDKDLTLNRSETNDSLPLDANGRRSKRTKMSSELEE